MLGMEVVVFARPERRDRCESEGFRFAATAAAAAIGANFLILSVGLGPLTNGGYANRGLVGSLVLDQLSTDAVIVNYDRGEIVDTHALSNAIADGRIRRVCVDADVFVDANGGITGPLVPYISLSKEFANAFELLPHVAADTDHLSRVAGAKQAIDQIIRAIRFNEVTNLKGDLPDGYVNIGLDTVAGIGTVTLKRVHEVGSDDAQIAKLRSLSETGAAFWQAISSARSAVRRAELLERYASRLILESNRYSTTLEELGLRGPMF
jgi:hypothetical protein